MYQVTKEPTDHDGDCGQHQLNCQIDDGNLARSTAESFQDCYIVVMPFAVAFCSQGDGNACQQDGEQGAQQEKTLCPIQRCTDFLALLADIAYVVASTPFFPGPEPGFEFIQHVEFVVGKKITVTDPATELYHIGPLHIIHV